MVLLSRSRTWVAALEIAFETFSSGETCGNWVGPELLAESREGAHSRNINVRSDTTGHMNSSAIWEDPIILHDVDRISPVQAQMVTETDY
jgi:hypothetical protein